MCKQATLTENEATFFHFLLLFAMIFRDDFWRRSLYKRYTRGTYIKSHYTQEPSGEVSPDLAVPLGALDVGEVDT